MFKKKYMQYNNLIIMRSASSFLIYKAKIRHLYYFFVPLY